MRNSVLAIVLVLLALVPIFLWGYTAYGAALSYHMAVQGSHKTGQAAAILILILAGLTPAFIGGIAMIVGAGLLRRKPLGARVTATVGLVLIILTVAVVIAFEGVASDDELVAGAVAYMVAHAGIIVWTWLDGRRRAV